MSSNPLLPEPAQPQGGPLDGPWCAGFWFAVPGQVRSKSNHRSGVRSRAGGDWAAIRGYELEVASVARRHRPDSWLTPAPGSATSTRPQVVVVTLARARVDAGNLDKCVLDALEGVAFLNDAQVLSSTGARIWASTGHGLLVGLAMLSPAASLTDAAAASAALSAALLGGPFGPAPL